MWPKGENNSAMTNQHSHDHGKKGKRPLGDRYWSLMLVGDHGRIIPFRRFKGIATAFIAVLMITLIALTVLSFLYLRQTNTMKQLSGEMNKLKDQANRLRDEKDMLLARLVIENKIIPEEQKRPTPAADAADDTKTAKSAHMTQKPVVEKPAPSIEKAAQKTPEPEPKSEPPKVKLGAEVRQFSIAYDRKRAILGAKFRVYNDSEPKVPLTGRAIVVFKKAQDPPMKWIPVPTVQISNSRPDGKNGKLFKIKNYRTITLNAYGMKPPIVYDTAAVYVYSETGDLLLNEEHEFKIEEPPPPPPPQPAPTAPAAPAEDLSLPEKNEPPETDAVETPAFQENTTDSGSESKASESDSTPAQDSRQYLYPDPYNVQKEDAETDSETRTTAPGPEPPEKEQSADTPGLEPETPPTE